MKRKVNKVGNNTLTVSLPTKWAKKYKIKPGDELQTKEINKGLVFSPEELTDKDKKVSVRFTKEDKTHIRSRISRLYRLGYSIIDFWLEESTLLAEVKKGIEVCMGAELDEFEGKKGTIKVFFRNEEIDYEKYIVKLIVSYKCILEQLKNDLEKGKNNNYNIINEYRKNGWKFREYIIRYGYLNYHSYEEFIPLISFLFFLEKFGRSLQRFYRVYVEKNKKIIISKEDQKYFGKLHEILDILIKYVSKKGIMTFQEENFIREKLREIEGNILNVDQQNPKTNKSFLTEIYNVNDYIDSSISNLVLYKQIRAENLNIREFP